MSSRFLRIIFPAMAVLLLLQPVQAREFFFPKETYLLPQTIFVGDRGRLVAVLDPVFENIEAFIFQSPGEIKNIFQEDNSAELKDLVINRIELEKRNNQIRLLIDFVPYAPGLLSIPPLSIERLGSEPIAVTGLELNVASILTPELMALADSAPPLAVPGTGFLIYGAVFAVLLILFLGICGFIWGRRNFRPLLVLFKRRRLIGSLERLLRQLRSESIGIDPHKQQELFSLLAHEFREFLSLFTGINCRAFTPPEFLGLPVLVSGGPGPEYLCGLFRYWDRLRFSGGSIDRKEVLEVLDELGSFILKINNAEKAP